MAGFPSLDAQINSMSALGNTFSATWAKQFNPTAAAVAQEWHTMFRGGGNPQADALFDTGTNLQFQSVYDITTNANCIQHGGNIGEEGAGFKTLVSGMTQTTAPTVVPATIKMIDVLAFHRVTTVTTTTAQTCINTNTFTASSSSGLLLTYANDWSNFQKVRFTTTTTLPAGLALNTDYWLVRQSATTAKVSTTLANAIAGTFIAFTDAGTGTHTLTCRLPRYSDGVGVKVAIFNPSATALGAGTPQLLLNYTNSAGTAGRLTPTSPSAPIGKTGATNSHVLYTGATGAGKFGVEMPFQGSDTGARLVQTIQNSTSYVSGSYTLMYFVPIVDYSVQVLGQATFIDHTTGMQPLYPRIFDGAALYPLIKSNVATPANSLIEGKMNFGWL